MKKGNDVETATETTPIIVTLKSSNIGKKLLESINTCTVPSIVIPAAPKTFVNEWVYLVQSRSLPQLLLYALLYILFITLMFATVGFSNQCYSLPLSVDNAITIYVGLLTSLFGGMGPLWNQTTTCAITYMIVSMSSFLINIFAISTLVNKITQPEPKLAISPNAVIKTRDGVPVFQVRYASKNGSRISDICVRMCSYCPTQSAEGEQYVSIKELVSETGKTGGWAVQSANHFITEDSPVYGLNFIEFKGFIEVCIEGFDEYLGCKVKETAMFDSSNIKVGFDFANMFIVSPVVLLQNPPGVCKMDFSKLGDVQELSVHWRDLTFKTLRIQHELKSEEAMRKKEVIHAQRSEQLS